MMDLHAHSVHSDGSASVDEIVSMAATLGLSLCAVTDHDCIDGTERSMIAGRDNQIAVLAGIELSVAFDCELHLLGYGFDYRNDALSDFMRKQDQQRIKRNDQIIEKLKELGVNIQIKRDDRGQLISRTHIAAAIVEANYAVDIRDAFKKYLGQGAPARFELDLLQPAEAIQLIHDAGGVCVLAHPGQLLVDCEETVTMLKNYGLDGIEAYYAEHSLREVRAFRDMALQHNLFITTGSDYHGAYRQYATFGSVAEVASFDSMIRETEQYLLAMANQSI